MTAALSARAFEPSVRDSAPPRADTRESMNFGNDWRRCASAERRREPFELPPKTFTYVSVTLAGEQLRMYEELRQQLELWIRDLSGNEILANAENILTG